MTENLGLSAAKRRVLAALDIPVWQLRQLGHSVDAPVVQAPTLSPTGPEPEQASATAVNPLTWPQLRQRVSSCQLCELHQQRKQTVFGGGDEAADWLIIGEAPGEEEDQLGEPFVGPAGKLLDNVLGSIGLSRAEVFIANIVKCRPPGNRDPHVVEREACRAYLLAQIELLQPRIILLLGRVAAQSLLDTDEAVGRLRGQKFSFGEREIPVVVTYHPAYLLRSPGEKSKVWNDLCFARERYNQHLDGR